MENQDAGTAASSEMSAEEMCDLANRIAEDYQRSSETESQSHSEHNSSTENIDTELLINKPEKKYKCSLCSFQTNHRGHSERHMKLHEKIECYICKIQFESYQLQQHIKKEHETAKVYKCTKCVHQTIYKQNLVTHMKRKHEKPERSVRPPETYHGPHLFVCDICNKNFSTKGNLKTHKENVHAANKSEKKYKCSQCPFQTNIKVSFQGHMYKHERDKQGAKYQCSICPYKTTHRKFFNRHMQKHSDNKQFQCKYCKKKFKLVYNILKHLKIRHTRILYRCSKCSYKTPRIDYMVVHLIEHKNLKQFQCRLCNKKFANRNNLERHVKDNHKDHKVELDYKCPGCCYQTHYKGYFQKHLSRFGNVEPFACNVCNEKYHIKAYLLIHMKNEHTALKPAKRPRKTRDVKLECGICAAKLSSKGNLKRHIIKIHLRNRN